MIRVLFVCHGNICRSPMAEFVFKDMVQKTGLESQFFIASAATSTEEIGNPVHPGTARRLAKEPQSAPVPPPAKGKPARAQGARSGPVPSAAAHPGSAYESTRQLMERWKAQEGES